jgi:hypothetical protein
MRRYHTWRVLPARRRELPELQARVLGAGTGQVWHREQRARGGKPRGAGLEQPAATPGRGNPIVRGHLSLLVLALGSRTDGLARQNTTLERPVFVKPGWGLAEWRQRGEDAHRGGTAQDHAAHARSRPSLRRRPARMPEEGYHRPSLVAIAGGRPCKEPGATLIPCPASDRWRGAGARREAGRRAAQPGTSARGRRSGRRPGRGGP